MAGLASQGSMEAEAEARMVRSSDGRLLRAGEPEMGSPVIGQQL